MTSDKLRKVMFVLLLSAKANGNKMICAKSASSARSAGERTQGIISRGIATELADLAQIILQPEP